MVSTNGTTGPLSGKLLNKLRGNILAKPGHNAPILRSRGIPYHIVNRIPPPDISSRLNAIHETSISHRKTFMKRKKRSSIGAILKRSPSNVNATMILKGSTVQSSISDSRNVSQQGNNAGSSRSKNIVAGGKLATLRPGNVTANWNNISNVVTKAETSLIPIRATTVHKMFVISNSTTSSTTASRSTATTAVLKSAVPAAKLSTTIPPYEKILHSTLTKVPRTTTHSAVMRSTMAPVISTAIVIHISAGSVNTSNEKHGNSTRGLHKFFFIKYRNRDSFTSTACLTGLLLLLFVGVWYTKMWQKRVIPQDSYDEAMDYISVKDILKSKARFLPMFKKKFRWLRRKKKVPKAAMKPLLEASSDSEEDLYTQI